MNNNTELLCAFSILQITNNQIKKFNTKFFKYVRKTQALRKKR